MSHRWYSGFLLAGRAVAYDHDTEGLDFMDFCIMIFWTLIAVMIGYTFQVVMGLRLVRVTQRCDQATQTDNAVHERAVRTDDVDGVTTSSARSNSRKRKIMMNLKTQSQTSYTATMHWKRPRFYVLPEHEQGALQTLVHEAQWHR